MTLIVGIRNNDSAILAADTMVTFSNVKASNSKGGTITGQTMGFHRNDTAHKLTRLSDNCIGTFAGTVALGNKAIHNLNKLNSFSKVEIENTLKSIKPTGNQSISLLVSFYDFEKKTCFLLRWRSNNASIFDYGNLFIEGSGSSILSTKNKLELLNKLKDESAKVMGRMLVLGLNQDLFHKVGRELSRVGVGGFFSYFGLDHGKFFCQEDFAILKIELSKSDNLNYKIYLLAGGYRKGIFFINSMLNNERRALLNPFNCDARLLKELDDEGLRSVIEKYEMDIENLFGGGNAPLIKLHFNDANVQSIYFAIQPGTLIQFDKSIKLPEGQKAVIITPALKTIIASIIKEGNGMITNNELDDIIHKALN